MSSISSTSTPSSSSIAAASLTFQLTENAPKPNSDTLTKLANKLSCPLTKHIFKNPVQAPSPSGWNRTYEEAAIVKLLRDHFYDPQDPYTGQPLHEWDLRVNHFMKKLVKLQLQLFPQLREQQYSEPDITPKRVIYAPRTSAKTGLSDEEWRDYVRRALPDHSEEIWSNLATGTVPAGTASEP